MNINVPAGTYTLQLDANTFLTNTAHIYLQCQTIGGAINIILPRITSVEGITTTWGFKIYVNDVSNNAATNNITITPHPADKINGTLSTPVVLNSNGITGHLQVTGLNSWEFNVSSSSGSGLTTIEAGTITLSASGLVATGGVLSGTASTPILTITTTRQLKLAFFNTGSNANHITSVGKSNLTKQDMVAGGSDSDGGAANFLNCIVIQNFGTGDGWVGKITAINATSFVMTFTKLGNGLAITSQWHGITG